MKLYLSLLLVLGSCSFRKNPLENQTLRGHSELYSAPEKLKTSSLEKEERRIVIASTNDVHANYQSTLVSVEDEHNKKSQNIRMGGVDVMASYFKILRDEYKNVVLVNSGDIFSESVDLKTTREFYNFLGYDALTVGLSDFNLKIPSSTKNNSEYFQDFAKKSEAPLIFSNLYELKTARVVEWEGTKPYILKEIGGVKVGIIGLVPNDVVEKTPVNNRVGFYVDNMLQSTLGHARLLRSLGADLIVVVTHQGVDCASELSEKSGLPLDKVNFEPLKSSICDLDKGLGDYLKRLPPQLVDVVVGGRTPQKMANFVNGTLVMSGYSDGKSFNFAEFVVDTKTKKIVPEKTVVHQPVQFCHEFFKETKDCYPNDKSINHSIRIPATFLGKPIQRDLSLEKKFPNLSQDKLAMTKADFDISKGIVTHKADLTFIKSQNGESQLFVMAIPGKELVRFLEEDYNRKKSDYWKPSPYLLKDGALQIMISGLDLELEKTYRILTDLESIQKTPGLTKYLKSFESESIMHSSWSSIKLEEDTVSSQLASRVR